MFIVVHYRPGTGRFSDLEESTHCHAYYTNLCNISLGAAMFFKVDLGFVKILSFGEGITFVATRSGKMIGVSSL